MNYISGGDDPLVSLPLTCNYDDFMLCVGMSLQDAQKIPRSAQFGMVAPCCGAKAFWVIGSILRDVYEYMKTKTSPKEPRIIHISQIPMCAIKPYKESMADNDPTSIWLMYNPAVLCYVNQIRSMHPILRSLVLFNSRIFQWKFAEELEAMFTFLLCTNTLNDLALIILEYYRESPNYSQIMQ